MHVLPLPPSPTHTHAPHDHVVRGNGILFPCNVIIFIELSENHKQVKTTFPIKVRQASRVYQVQHQVSIPKFLGGPLLEGL